MRLVKGYRLIDIPLGMGGSLHTLYVKEHAEKVATSSSSSSSSSSDSNHVKGRTAFIGNVDFGNRMELEEIDAYLRHLFAGFGEIISVSVSKFQQDDNGEDDDEESTNANSGSNYSRFAHVVFSKKSGLKAALSASESTYFELGQAISRKWGLGKRFDLKRKLGSEEIAAMFPHVDVDSEELQAEVDSYMQAFEEQEEIDKKERDRKSRLPDEDGFMPVQHRKKRKRVQEKRGTGTQRPRKEKKEKKELTNFYRFQIREQRKGKLDDLRAKFEQDKERVAAMKAARKFKPF